MIDQLEIERLENKITKDIHADGVFRDITAREDKRPTYEKRWFWELLQNAKDSIDKSENIKIKIEISANLISFSHTGNPFEINDILSLIIQGSSKDDKDKVGRFGTGFMTTYLLSKEVYITGGYIKDNKKSYFHFLLNRNAKDKESFRKLQEKSSREFKESIREESYIDTDFQTKFSYNLDEKGKNTAKIGLECLDELIPVAQLFNKQIESITIIENEKIKTFTKSHIEKHSIDEYSINEWEISTVIDGTEIESFKAYIFNDNNYETCIITQTKDGNEVIYPLNENYPRLYFTFPLLGTEEIGIPIIINSINFHLGVERNEIYLTGDIQNEKIVRNKKTIKEAILKSLNSYALLFLNKNIKNIFELFNLKISKNYDWIDHNSLTETKNDAIDLLSSVEIIKVHSKDKLSSLKELIIPYTVKDENIKTLWELLSDISRLKVPLAEELNNWVDITKSITDIKSEILKPSDLNFVWGTNELLDFVEQHKSLDELNESIKIDGHDWLNRLYLFIIKTRGHFPLERKICLNRRRHFRKAEGISWDECNDEILISISDLIDLNFADKLFSTGINTIPISGVGNFTLDAATSEIKSKLNEFTEADFSNTSYQECNAQFLRWLISNKNKETIQNLKVLTGKGKKDNEDFVYDYFPKREHLLLSPKSHFEIEFPLYSNLVRDKDCLNNIYDNFLSISDYHFLNDHGLIHMSPLVQKTNYATIRLLEQLIVNEDHLNLLRDGEGQLKDKFKITYSDFAYLTTTDGHIYARNISQKSSLERLKFLLTEAVEKDILFDNDRVEMNFEGIEHPIYLKQCLWIYRAKRLNWINVKTEGEGTESKLVSETPSSKNLAELLKENEDLIKTISDPKRQLFLNKLGVGVSDLIRNTLPTDELRLSWDEVITKMITSEAGPELAQEIFNDPNIRKEYEYRIKRKELINSNQLIGKLIEDLFKEYIEELRESGVIVNIDRKPFGSDYILTEDSSYFVNDQNQCEELKINNWLIELKATGKEHASMTPLQAETATEQKDNYALIVVPLDGTEPNIEYLRQKAKVITDIGHKIDGVFTDYNEVEDKKNILNNGQDGISVNIENQNIRFRVSSEIWNSSPTNIETFIKTFFTVST